jgi:hypothetical protein
VIKVPANTSDLFFDPLRKTSIYFRNKVSCIKAHHELDSSPERVALEVGFLLLTLLIFFLPSVTENRRRIRHMHKSHQKLIYFRECRGTLTAIQPGAVFTAAPVGYVADHDTDPPADQVIKTDPTSILIRGLQGKKAKEEAKKRHQQTARAADKGKRPADSLEAGRAPKRIAPGEAGPSGASLGAGTSSPFETLASHGTFNRLNLVAKTIKDLQTILRAWGLPVTGKKDDLISRILERQSSAAAGGTGGGGSGS